MKGNHLHLPIFHQDTQDSHLAKSENFVAENISKCHLDCFQFDKQKKESVNNNIHFIKQLGIPLVLVHVPVRQAYIDYFNDAPAEQKTEYQKTINYVKSLEETNHEFFWLTPEDIGFTDGIYLDYGHFSVEGSEKFSRYLLESIVKENWLPRISQTKK